MPNDPDKQRQWAAAARRGLDDEAERLRREGPTLHRHRAVSQTLGEALSLPGAEDVDFDPPKAGVAAPRRSYVTDEGEAKELDEQFFRDAKRGRP